MAFKIYTKTGDKGQTSLFGGRRLPKDHLRIDAYGTIDELNAHLGLVADTADNPQIRTQIQEIQNRLFVVGASLASDPDKAPPIPDILHADVVLLESWIDTMEASLEPLKNFILPGGHPTVSNCHVARCVCRRAERLVVALHHDEHVEPLIMEYLNRLSDYLFVLCRYLAKQLGVVEICWIGRAQEG